MKFITILFSVIILSGCVSLDKYNNLNEKLISLENTINYQEKYESLKVNYDDKENQIEYYQEMLNNYFTKNNQVSQNLNLEPWGENWQVIQNSRNEYYPTGWYNNTDYLKEIISLQDFPESNGFILLHPIDRNTPAIIEFNGLINKNRQFFNSILTGSIHGDHLFQIEINNEIIKDVVIGGEKWETIRLDLTEYNDEEVNIKLYVYAGGQELWQFEHCFITEIFFTNKKI